MRPASGAGADTDWRDAIDKLIGGADASRGAGTGLRDAIDELVGGADAKAAQTMRFSVSVAPRSAMKD